VARLDEIAFAAGLRRAGEIVEVGAVPPDAAPPVVSLVFHVHVEPLARRHRAGRRVRCRDQRAIELQRVREIEPISHCGRVLVALQHRIGRLEVHAARKAIGTGRGFIERNRRRRSNTPLFHDRALFGEAFSEERDGAHVFERLRLDARRHEARAGIAEHDQRIAAERDRTEEAGLRVGHGVELLRLKVVAKNIRRARVV
jgi:hypothetical protein